MPTEYFRMSTDNRRPIAADQQQKCAECNQDRPTQRFPTTSTPTMSRLLIVSAILLLVAAMPAPAQAAVHSVFTYSNASSTLGQLVTSSTLAWATYDPLDASQLAYAVEGGKYITDDEHYPIYVCRVRIDGVTKIGHTEKILQQHVCVAAHYKRTKYDNFDVLINKGHLGKIAWKHWRKFNAGVPVGAISIEEGTYIARHKAAHHSVAGTSAEDHRGADYNLGWLDQVGLGKVNVMENDREHAFEDGEVLVETEPYRYELRDIKLDTIRLDMRENITELATGILMNRDDKYSMVEMVMSYEFNHVQNWGAHEGLARGLPTKIFEKDAPHPIEINWGLKHSEKRFETKSVQTKLWPGTALNVTLRGNYVTLEAPYSAKLLAFYYGSEDIVRRQIKAEVRKSYLKDVKLEFGAVYWIDNGTVVPTTTSTTSSSTSTSTTTHATTTSHEPTPMHEPPVVHVTHVGDVYSGRDSLEKSLDDAPHENEIASEVPENLKHQKPALAGVAAGSAAFTAGITSFAAWCVCAGALALTAATTAGGQQRTRGGI